MSFTVRPGESIGVVGRNGQGKSTLLKLVAGVLLSDEGEVTVHGGVAPLIEITGGFVGFRSYDSQVAVFNRYVRERGVAGAELTSARPSFSEHQTGLAADVTAPAEGCAIAQCFGGTTAGRWVADNAWRFGFIVRYPNGYTSVTGYEWEPWHVRYVGASVAREMHDGGIPTYEQYLGAAAAPTY